MSDNIQHECGIALIRLLKPISYYAEKYKTPLYALDKLYILMEKQHNRGQDGAGIGIVNFDVAAGNKYMYRKRSVETNPIADIFRKLNSDFVDFGKKYPLNDYSVMKDNLPFMGELLLGHLRYGTHGENDISHCHPFHRKSNYKTKNLMLAGNFNMTNNEDLFKKLVELGQYPVNKTDTIIVLEKIAHFLDSENEYIYHKYKDKGYSKKEITKQIINDISLEYILKKSARDFDGGYVIAGLIGHGDAFVLRDPSGIRPVYYYKDDEVVVVASEKPAIRTSFNKAFEEISEITPGHALLIRKNGVVEEKKILEPKEKKACSFERIYFSRGTDDEIYKERKQLGKNLASRVLDEVDNDIKNTVFSYIPNTSEVAFLGLITGVEQFNNKIKIEKILNQNAYNEKELDKILSTNIRVEKISVKDTKLRTFITEDKGRSDLVAHVYDNTYGVINEFEDNLVILDDSIVRGTTLKESIIRILDRLGPKKIVVVSSAPQIRYPDCYGIDMSKLRDFVAFRAAIELIKEKGKDYILKNVYHKCKAQVGLKDEDVENYVKEIYKQSSVEEISNKIAELVRPENMNAELKIIYQSIEDLHSAIPKHTGDWYFTGNFPTDGGKRVVNQSFINYYEGNDERAY
ncbi:MAG: amidophosphoribosyltransferase [Bacteroidota bacterium]|nr:amidophosphoribosyltransferase [Bacteroidota bacterium]